MIQDRVAAARHHLAPHCLDAILFLHMPDIRYLTGFTGSDAALVVGDGYASFLTDSRYTTQAGSEVSGCEIIEYSGKIAGVSDLLGSREARRLGIQADYMTVSFHRSIQEKNPGLEIVPLARELESLRICKDEEELALLSAVAETASSAFLAILNKIRPGVSETELALALEWEIRRRGADDKSFEFIVASGERGALPHGKASTKLLAAGELVTFDFGALRNGYVSDETATVALGEPDARQREIYEVVKEAHDRAVAAVKPGISFRDLDATARDFIAAKGYGDRFGHGLGHGVGLEVHEKPVVSPRSDGIVEEGMVFTIEPGIYIPGFGGVRIEDTVRVTATGCEVITKVPKELMII